ncbi:NAD(P)/FAD-dependent oxidoreductase, partial [Pseudomonas syringae pv. tagetis]
EMFCDNKYCDIMEMLLEECLQAGANLLMDSSVQQIEKTESGYSLQSTLGPRHCQSLVIGSGVLSIPSLRATGVGYQLGK